MASGPYALGLLSAAGVASLSPLMRACLSLIALAAGAELHLPDLQRLRTQASLAAFCWDPLACRWLCTGACHTPYSRSLNGSPMLPPRLAHPLGAVAAPRWRA